MVEMLGVLAIMGIVGLVGIKMYTNAMNRHRANELIYEAQKRATMVASQIVSGRDTLSVAGFTNPTGYTFGVEKNPANDNQFNITLNTVPEEVCVQMKTMIGNGTVVRAITDDCKELTFNNDLSHITEAQCQAEGKIWCAATGYCSNTGDCCLSGDCTASNCPTGSETNKTGGSTGVFVNGTECKCDTGYVYVGNECVQQPTSCTSWTTNECGKGYYCSFSYTSANLNPDLGGSTNMTEPECYIGIENQGTCTEITQVTQPTPDEMKLLRQAGFKSTFLKGPFVNWWNANSWCQAQGRHLITIDEIDCYRKSNNTLIKSGEKAAYCCKKGQSCQQSSWNTNQTNALWNGKEILPGKEAEVAKFSDKMVALRKVYGSKVLWTASSYGNTSINACYTFYIAGDSGLANPNYNRSGRMEILCQ